MKFLRIDSDKTSKITVKTQKAKLMGQQTYKAFY